MTRASFIHASALSIMLLAAPALSIGAPIAQPNLPRDLQGHAVDPFSATNIHVLVFIGVDCPISNRYAPELKRLYKKFAPNGVEFWFVYPNSKRAAPARSHSKEYQIPGRLLLDPSHALVRRAHATVTPEAAVFGPGGQLLYHGRIDDRYAAFGKVRREPTQRDLEGVLSSLLAGKPLLTDHEPAIGCYIPALR